MSAMFTTESGNSRFSVANPVSVVSPRFVKVIGPSAGSATVRSNGITPPSAGKSPMNTTMRATITPVAEATLQNGVPYCRWIRENGRGACPCRPISDPIPLAARMLAFEALTMLNIAPATISDRPAGPRKPAATRPHSGLALLGDDFGRDR